MPVRSSRRPTAAARAARTGTVLTGVLALCLLPGPAAATPAAVPPATTAAAPAAEPAAVDVTRLVDGRPVTTTLTTSGGRAAEALADRLEDRRDVLAADVAVRYRPVGGTLAHRPAAGDPLLGASQHLYAARASRAWTRTTGTGVVVAVLDTRVVTDHPDLRGALLPGVDTVARGDDHEDGTPSYHGTLVASVIAARAGNDAGGAGVAPGAQVLPVRVCAPECSSGALTAGIDAAVARGADVINLSVAGTEHSRVLADAVQRAVAAGVVVVAAAGNDGSPCTATLRTGCGNPVMYPAAYPGVVSVSASTPTGLAAPWAVHNDRVDLSATGERVLGAVPPRRAGVYDGSEYGSGTGTSFSAPQVAGAAALVRGVAPELPPAAVEELLRSTAARTTWPAGYGRGQLDVAAAVAAAAHAPGGQQPVVAQPDGSVAYTRDGRVHVVRGAVLDRYRATGAEDGPLGWPVTGEVAVRGGAFTHFEGGSVYWSPATGAQLVRGAILDRWAAAGRETSPLGFPAGEEVPLRGGGAVQRFTGGPVYWSPATGAHDVRGAILGAYGAAGWENGVLGYPVTGEVPLAGGAFNHFQRGSVYWSPATGAQLVRGAIRDAWARAGWERSRHGYPVTGEQLVYGGVRQVFQRSVATYSWATGRVTFSAR
ncbi:hypothetical protein NUM3379_27360 [Kineococcus sp. NUM-3379]